MKEKLPTIYKVSPNLFNVLNSIFNSEIDENLDHIFKKCIESGGLDEIDFSRPEGQSYNPRPARVALILLNDCKQKNQKLIESALLATIKNDDNALSIEANQICQSPDSTIAYQRESKLIALALHLDRARHFHLSNNYKKQKREFHLLTKKILEIAGGECQTVNHLINHWLLRDEKRN